VAAEEEVSERELEVRRAEQDAAEMEAQLGAEADRLKLKAAGLIARMQQVKASAAHQQLSGAHHPLAAELHQRTQSAAPPALDLGELRERSLRARLHAVNERMKAAAAIREAIEAFAGELAAWSALVERDEATVARIEKEIEAESARRATEEQRKREEARRRAAEAQVLASARAVADARAHVAPTRDGTTAAAHKRVRVRVRMQAAIDLHSDSNFYTGFSTNISEGGIFVATVDAPPRGAMVELRFCLPNGKRIDVRGEIRWSREVNDKTPDIFPGVGVQFIDLAPEAQAEIRAFVAEREPMFFPD
jgi:uncharacterized protein (TIGR02266 family)